MDYKAHTLKFYVVGYEQIAVHFVKTKGKAAYINKWFATVNYSSTDTFNRPSIN
jgi:hypothetical protein